MATPEHLDFNRFKETLRPDLFWYARLLNKDEKAPHQSSCIQIKKEKWILCGEDGEEKRAKSDIKNDNFYAVYSVYNFGMHNRIIEDTGCRVHKEKVVYTLKEAIVLAEIEAKACEDYGNWRVTRIDNLAVLNFLNSK